jgi:hypothetical protein
MVMMYEYGYEVKSYYYLPEFVRPFFLRSDA